MSVRERRREEGRQKVSGEKERKTRSPEQQKRGCSESSLGNGQEEEEVWEHLFQRECRRRD